MPFPKNVRIGCAGWTYPHWQTTVFDDPSARGIHRLEFLARFLDTVEINASFYQFLRPEASRVWISKLADRPEFVFSARLNRVFTHERKLDRLDVHAFREGLLPLKRAGKLGCLTMQFPTTFTFGTENRKYFLELRRAFHEFALVAEMHHASWTSEEALGTLIDARVGFCNVIHPSSLLTARVAAVRLAQRDGLYSVPELESWKTHILRLAEHAPLIVVTLNNDEGGKSVVNALQLRRMLGDENLEAPAGLLERYPQELSGFHARLPVQQNLFAA